MSVARKMLDAMCHEGRGPRMAWLMFRATYAYTRSFDGEEVVGERMHVGRWYSFCCAARVGWDYLWPNAAKGGERG